MSNARAPIARRWCVYECDPTGTIIGPLAAVRVSKAAALRTIDDKLPTSNENSVRVEPGVYVYETASGSWWLVRREGRQW